VAKRLISGNGKIAITRLLEMAKVAERGAKSYFVAQKVDKLNHTEL
jgi:hypothetical protein